MTIVCGLISFEKYLSSVEIKMYDWIEVFYRQVHDHQEIKYLHFYKIIIDLKIIKH